MLLRVRRVERELTRKLSSDLRVYAMVHTHNVAPYLNKSMWKVIEKMFLRDSTFTFIHILLYS